MIKIKKSKKSKKSKKTKNSTYKINELIIFNNVSRFDVLYDDFLIDSKIPINNNKYNVIISKIDVDDKSNEIHDFNLSIHN